MKRGLPQPISSKGFLSGEGNRMRLKGKKFAILLADFYQPIEFWYPYHRLKEEGADVKIVCRGEFHSTRFGNRAPDRDLSPEDARHGEFDAVVIPGGYSPDAIRDDEDMLRFVADMNRAGKLIAAICHGPWVAISAEIVKGRTMTCYPAMRDDAKNAGAKYVDTEAVRDGNLVTSRDPYTVPDFFREILAAFSQPADLNLKRRKVAVLVDDYYEILSFWYPYNRLKEAGAEVKVISRQTSHFAGDAFPTRYPSAHRDLAPEEARGEDYDALVVPGGYAPDYLRANTDVLRLVHELNDAGKTIASVAQGAWVLISAGIAKGRTLACSRTIRVDVKNAGGQYVDREVARHDNLVTCRSSSDLPAFGRELIAAIASNEARAAIARDHAASVSG